MIWKLVLWIFDFDCGHQFKSHWQWVLLLTQIDFQRHICAWCDKLSCTGLMTLTARVMSLHIRPDMQSTVWFHNIMNESALSIGGNGYLIVANADFHFLGTHVDAHTYTYIHKSYIQMWLYHGWPYRISRFCAMCIVLWIGLHYTHTHTHTHTHTQVQLISLLDLNMVGGLEQFAHTYPI